jgi:D-alanyl-D-alanine carboxypeptidase
MQDPMVMDQALQRSIAEKLRQANVPGASVAVIDASGEVSTAVFGLADVGASRPVEPSTVFHLFSATKLYTAAAVVLLAERGLLDLDDPVTAHLGDIRLAYPVTIRQLATHTSGLADTLRAFIAVHFPDEPAPSTSEALARYRLDKGKPPEDQVAYRNVNFALLGEVISRASGEPYEDFVTSDLLDPLGSGARFASTEAMRSHAATGYLGRWDPMRLALRLLLPGRASRLTRPRSGGFVGLEEFSLDTAAIGGLVGCARDFLPFLGEFLREGDGVLPRSWRHEMLTVQVEGKAGITSAVGMGLGWKAGQVGDVRFWNHEGGGPGFATETRLYPADGLGMVILMNRTHKPALSRVAHDVTELIRLNP